MMMRDNNSQLLLCSHAVNNFSSYSLLGYPTTEGDVARLMNVMERHFVR